MTSAPRGKRARSFVQLDEIGQIIIIKSSTNNDAAQVQARSLAHSRRCTLAEREREGKVRTGRPPAPIAATGVGKTFGVRGKNRPEKKEGNEL